ncbi:MAG: DNA-3-methyladenine glycosylase [bacterium]
MLNIFKYDFSKALALSFYQRKPEIVANELLGKIIVRKEGKIILAARIVETEAYLSKDDLSCHASVGKTFRNAPMFESGGVLYVYKIYGVHHCINFVTEGDSIGSAVLIRAAEPLAGIEKMMENRSLKKTGKGEGKKERLDMKINDLCKGPGNLAKSFGFTKEDNFRSLISPELFIQNPDKSDNIEVSVSKRIGITKSPNLFLRYFIENSPYVSGKKMKKL